jgi:predicted metal-binding membrane protein
MSIANNRERVMLLVAGAISGIVAGARTVSGRGAHLVLLGASVLLFAACAAVTILWGASMPSVTSASGAMPLCGSRAMSMAWMPVHGGTWGGTWEEAWPAAAAAFLGMWTAMTVAMMLPSLVPMLARYRGAVATRSEARLAWLTALAGAGYFAVWAALGVCAYALAGALAEVARQWPASVDAGSVAAGAVVAVAGAIQLTPWKARRLACCREGPGHDRTLPADAGTAWRHGLRLGLQCVRCCGNLMAILLAAGIMSLGAMAAVTAAITAERLAPAGASAARATGAAAVAAGVLIIARASGFG